MAKPLPQPFDKQKVVAENRRARFDYFVEERFEAGIQLAGTEVKSLRQCKLSGVSTAPHATNCTKPSRGNERWIFDAG